MRPYLSAAKVAVAPLLIGRGIQNKVLEAMAMGRAVVASSAALEGLDVQAGRDVLQAETPEQWHQSILELLSNQGRRRQLERSARACVVSKYNWTACLEPDAHCNEPSGFPFGQL